MVFRCGRGIAAAAAALTALSGCAPPSAPPTTPVSTGPDTTAVSASPATAGASGVPFALYTHCGIYEARVRDTFFVADQPLDDGQGNPPAGWGNPYQPGTMTVTGARAVFRDDRGHAVAFHERPGATSFLRICS